MNNWIALIITFVSALGFLRIMDFFAHRGWIDSRLSRKIIHIGTGPIFVLCWLLFDNAPEARWMAALVPFAITIQFALIGLGILKDEASVKAMSRTGDPKEILRGPLLYGIAFVFITITFWKDSPIGITALMILCGGDGIADIIGRRVKSPKLLWSKEKSGAGSLAVFFGGLILALPIIAIYVSAGVFAPPLRGYILPLLIISFGSTIIESLPFKDIDNLSISLMALILGILSF